LEEIVQISIGLLVSNENSYLVSISRLLSRW
jgi:hypothetical protein